MAKPKRRTLIADKMNLVACARFEAGDRNTNPTICASYKLKFHNVVHDMWVLLDSASPNFARANRENADTRRASDAGYVPPPTAITLEPVQKFLSTHEGTKTDSRCRYKLDEDIPF